MSNIVKVAKPITKAGPLVNAQLKLAKHSPEILIGLGIVSMVGSTVLACRATLKAPAAVKKAKETFAGIEEARVTSLALVEQGECETYSKKDRQQDLVKATVQTGYEIVKLYAVPAILMGAGVFMITKGHSITMKRNAALSAAFSALTKTMADYRQRVRDRVGEEDERHLYNNTKIEKVKGADGKKYDVVVPVDDNYPEGIYTRIFEEGNPCFGPSPALNLQFLKGMQNQWNDALRVRKIVFLNEILADLGFPITQAGQAVGWVYGDASSSGDGYIDFGIENIDFFENNGDFYDNRPVRFQLNFNVDGEVWNRLK